MKFIYSLFYGIMSSGIFCFVTKFSSPDADPEVILTCIVLTFTTGCIIGWIDAGRKQRKKEEEEERRAEQDRTNELMRHYLEKKLREEEKEKQS